jgi:hypothetical protein
MTVRVWHDSVDLEYDGDEFIELAISYSVDHGSIDWGVDRAWISTTDDDVDGVIILLEGQEAKKHPRITAIGDWIYERVREHAGL